MIWEKIKMSEDLTIFQQIHQIDEEIKKLKPVVSKIKNLEKERLYLIERAVEQAKENKIYQYENLKLKNIPKKSSIIKPELFQKKYPEEFWSVCKINKGAAEELVGKWGLEDIMEVNLKDSWHVVDLWEEKEGKGEE
jgi:hypothetical protein